MLKDETEIHEIKKKKKQRKKKKQAHTNFLNLG
jgi:hypothetical protein